MERRLRAALGSTITVQDRGHFFELTGQADSWAQAVEAGRIAAKYRKGKNIVSRVTVPGLAVPPMEKPSLRDSALEGAAPDVLVVGGGITGCAIARELTRHKLRVLLVEKEQDLALHASSRNDGMVHPGIDLKKGTAKYRFNKEGNPMFDQLCADLGVPFWRCGQTVCFTKRGRMPLLMLARLYWRFLGIPGVRVLGKKALRRREPTVSGKVRCAVLFPNAGIVCPYSLTIALGENAVENGAQVSLQTAALGMEVENGRIVRVQTNRGTVYPRLVVNAAGVFADEVAAMAGDQFYSIHPRRGTNSILDKKYSQELCRTVMAAVDTKSNKAQHTKGGGIVRTVEGNTLVGPDAVETFERENFATQRESIQATFAKQQQAAPALSPRQIITYFTGVRASTYTEDFVVQMGVKTKNLVHAAGIQSPGLTAAPAIGVEVARLAVEQLSKEKPVEPNPGFSPLRKPIVKAAELPNPEREALIRQDPDYGVILCRCEEVSLGEMKAALHRPIPCHTVDGVKRRVRAGMGRCQGGFCGPLVAVLIARELGMPLEAVQKNGEGSPVVLGPVKGGGGL